MSVSTLSAAATPSEKELQHLARFCAETMREAGALAQRAFEEPRGIAYNLKGPQDILTETDQAVEDFIRSRIHEAFPEHDFLGEETGGSVKGLAWVVDPIDGTANFARQIPHYCISVAFVANGETVLGAIYNPATKELFEAQRGAGATRNGIPIRVSSQRSVSAASVELGWSTRLPLETYLTALSALIRAGVSVRRGASGAMGLAYVADGRSDAYAELHMHAWDCLAGLLLVKEAGGVIAPFPTGEGMIEGGAVLAASPIVAQLVSKATGIALEKEAGASAIRAGGRS
ncbi:inositol monophosphatase family protein [Cucumibacter marinus]|uniref:inositol monophosphatase family protein n=1 Tax=Cucumibacter marinus TaxID=1121252 RepID=UPI000423F3D3|nr:inositol monophosphatase family protein [Cucumibacter marinus]